MPHCCGAPRRAIAEPFVVPLISCVVRHELLSLVRIHVASSCGVVAFRLALSLWGWLCRLVVAQRDAAMAPKKGSMKEKRKKASKGKGSGAPKEEEETEWTGNEGEASDADEEGEAHQSLRGSACLVTASCLRQYPRDIADRKAKRMMIPQDFEKGEFLTMFRRVVNKHCNQTVVKATCHDEPHKRFRPSEDKRERHKHLAVLMSGNFAHKKVADAFQREHGIRISFSFKLTRFVGNLGYLMTPGKKPSTDLDLDPAKHPPNLDLKAELAAAPHPGAGGTVKESRKRKRLSFDEVSNIIIEGVGSGPLRTARSLEEASKILKQKGDVELWNYMGTMKTSSETAGLVSQVWRLHGSMAHPMWHTKAPYDVSEFRHGGLSEVGEWIRGKYKTHVLILSGDGGLGKTSLAEALISEVCPIGYWFVDDPDDLRELDGQIQPGHGLVVDEIDMASTSVNQIKKMFDLEKTRRVKCRHFNGTIPARCPRIFCTNSDLESFYPKMKNKHDRTGVMRRQLFQVVSFDVRLLHGPPGPLPTHHGPTDDWRSLLEKTCHDANLSQYATQACAAADHLGVALVEEVSEVAEQIATMLGMKFLERRRFLEHLRALFP